MSTIDQKLSLKEKISYGFGDLASVLYWQTFMLYFTFFYTDVFLIPAAAAATLFLLSRLWDGINEHGLKVPSGNYYYKISVDNYTVAKKMIFLK